MPVTGISTVLTGREVATGVGVAAGIVDELGAAVGVEVELDADAPVPRLPAGVAVAEDVVVPAVVATAVAAVRGTSFVAIDDAVALGERAGCGAAGSEQLTGSTAIAVSRNGNLT